MDKHDVGTAGKRWEGEGEDKEVQEERTMSEESKQGRTGQELMEINVETRAKGRSEETRMEPENQVKGEEREKNRSLN